MEIIEGELPTKSVIDLKDNCIRRLVLCSYWRIRKVTNAKDQMSHNRVFLPSILQQEG